MKTVSLNMNKSWWKAYAHFSGTERKGIAALLILLLLLIVFNLSMKYWVKPKPIQENKELAAAFEQYKADHPYKADNNWYGDNEPAVKGELFAFDPNTLDSAGFIKLGLRPKTTHLLLNWRRKGKTFYKKEDLKPLYTLKDEEYRRLEPFIRITGVAKKGFNDLYKREPPPASIDLNTTDSATLVRLRGIGPVIAHRIIAKRDALGGFLKFEQLAEVFPFSDTMYKLLKEKLVIKPEQVRRMPLNTVGIEELSAHPYISDRMAKNIILYRNGLKRFENIEQLRQVPLMNDEIYRKIAPYFALY